MMGGQVGITGHVEVTDFIKLATRTGVSKSLKSKGSFRGSPATSLNEYNRRKIHVKKLPIYVKKIKELEEKLRVLEEKLTF